MLSAPASRVRDVASAIIFPRPRLDFGCPLGLGIRAEIVLARLLFATRAPVDCAPPARPEGQDCKNVWHAAPPLWLVPARISTAATTLPASRHGSATKQCLC